MLKQFWEVKHLWGMPPKNSGGSTKFPGGRKVIHRTTQTAFVRVVTPRSYQTSNYTARKSALKLANLPSFLKGDTLRVSEDSTPKKGKCQNFTDVLMVEDTNLTPHHTNVCKIW